MVKTLFLLVLSIFCLNSITNSQTISSSQLDLLKGKWQGSLSYLDYSSGKLYTMPANLVVTKALTGNEFFLGNFYPDEPQANAIDTLILSDDGTIINGEKIISLQSLSNGDIKFITEIRGIDGNDNKPATIRHTYLLGPKTFSKRKEVKFDDAEVWINRNESSYSKTGS